MRWPENQAATSGPSRGWGKLSLAILIFILVPLLYVSIELFWGRPGTPRRFLVAKGAAVRDIARNLQAEGFVSRRWPLMIWARFTRGAIRPGVYTLAPGTDPRTLLRTLRHGPPVVKITFPEGWTARQMAAHLESFGITEAVPFLDRVAAQQAEGYLFPDTYHFEQGVAPEVVINRMMQRFREVLPTDFAAQSKSLRLTERQLVTLASLVEREARVPDERPVIAGVFLNRLKKRWRLESCATVQYVLGTWKPNLTYKDLDVQSPYNTYRHFGLPPGPIANPGRASLVAASHPTQTDMMFFVAEGGGTHRFTKYYNEHLAAQKKHTGHKP